MVFRNVMQENIYKGLLQIPEKGKEPMGVDSNPFSTTEVNMILVGSCSFISNCQGELSDLGPKGQRPLEARLENEANMVVKLCIPYRREIKECNKMLQRHVHRPSPELVLEPEPELPPVNEKSGRNMVELLRCSDQRTPILLRLSR